jgi:hypothetical protein
MTAHDLIASIFSRPPRGGSGSGQIAGNMRRITRAQLDFLRALIAEDEEGGAMQPGRGLSFVWMPSGRDKYVITEDPSGGDRHALIRLANIVPSGMGRLF